MPVWQRCWPPPTSQTQKSFQPIQRPSFVLFPVPSVAHTTPSPEPCWQICLLYRTGNTASERYVPGKDAETSNAGDSMLWDCFKKSSPTTRRRHPKQQSRVLVRIRDCCLGGPQSALINIGKKSPAYNDWLETVSATLVPTLLPSRQGIRTNTLYPPRSLSSGCS